MKRHAGEKGATLVELLAALAIITLIVGGVAGLIYQEWSGTAIAKTSVTASHEIGHAARLISQDGAMAASSNLVEGAQPTDQLTLTWMERHEFVDLPHVVNYWLEGTQLLRNYDGIIINVARDITAVDFSIDGDLLEVTISCTPPELNLKTVKKTYLIYLRTAELATTQ